MWEVAGAGWAPIKTWEVGEWELRLLPTIESRSSGRGRASLDPTY